VAQPPESKPLEGSDRLLASLAVGLATFMNVLDTSIANVSIPAIAGDLGVSPNQGTWVITSYAVANAISVPLTGWLTQRFGQVRLFVTSVLLFVVASILCGLAPSIELLIAARVLQGAVAGPMIPLSQALLLNSYPKEKSGTALGIWSITTLIAPVLGPILGGWISDNYSWPWIFLINIPIGLGAAFIIWKLYHKRESTTRKLPIDGVGLALLVLWVGSLQIMLDKGKELDWFNSGTIVLLAVTAFVGLVFFLIWELTEKHPIVDLTLFKRRNFWTGVIAFSLAYGAFFGNLVILPLWLQTQMGYTATDAGWVLAPVGLFAVLLTPIVGKNLNKWDPRWAATAGFATFALVFFMRSQFTSGIDMRALMIPPVLQ
jgi:DHA2 family multidrug resistance protein